MDPNHQNAPPPVEEPYVHPPAYETVPQPAQPVKADQTQPPSHPTQGQPSTVGYQPPPPAMGHQQPPPPAMGQHPPPPPGYQQHGYSQQPGYAQQGYPPPPPGYYPQQGQPGYTGTNTVIVQQPGYVAVVGPTRLGPNPQQMKCTHCQADVVTATDTKIGTMNWIVVGGLCLAGFAVSGLTWLGCQFIPLCIPALKDVEHKCPNCHRVIGVYERANAR